MIDKCQEWDHCKYWSAEEELVNRLSVAGIIGEIINDFFTQLGFTYLVLLILLILSIGYFAKGK